MAIGGWMKSLHCKSKAFDDVISHYLPSTSSSSSSSSSTCRSSLKDVVVRDNTTSRRSKPSPISKKSYPAKTTTTIITRFATRSFSLPPSLAELPEGYPSRNVVEIIFRSGWDNKDSPARVEMVFKVQNLSRAVSRFEEYREDVKNRAGVEVGGGEDHARCVADGNEMMRFYCLGASGGTANDGWGLQCGKGAGAGAGAGVCTYSGSGVAHEKGGGGRGRRAMLVCRVVAGRVCKDDDGGIGYDSVIRENGELYAFDARAVLPCFLVIYNNKLY